MRNPRLIPLLIGVALASCAPEPEGPSIPVLLDGREVSAVSVSELGATPRELAELLDGAAGDPGAWLSVGASTAEGRQFAVHQLATAHSDAAIYLDLDGDAVPRIGLFPRANPGSGPRVVLADPNEIRVSTAAAPPPPPPAAPEPVVLKLWVVGGEPGELTEKRLESVPQLGASAGSDLGGGGASGSGGAGGADLRREHHLADVVALAAELETVTAVRLSGEADYALGGDALRARSGVLPVLKRNRRGNWVFDLRGGEGRVLRDVRELEISVGGD